METQRCGHRDHRAPEKKIDTIEIEEELAKGDIQSILRMSKLVSDVSNEFKTYHYVIVNQIENQVDQEAEQETLQQHELKVMELVHRIAELVEEPSQTKEASETEESWRR